MWRAIASALRRSRPDEGTGLGLPCSVCGRPARSWDYQVSDVNGTQVVDGRPVCLQHEGNAEPGQVHQETGRERSG